MPEALPPSDSDRRAMMSAAIRQVKAAQRQLKEEQSQAAGPAQESLRPQETVVTTDIPAEQIAQWRGQYPETYKRILRATARGLEQNPQTRQRLYRLLNCAPEEQA
ncbi:MAG TPA: hypothetical protein DEB30_01540 [Candidatus Peribacter riflensis]|uniref:Uncharacterized protein n=1 Tax=Candidatus Peribacter riflensis TaxID=1735162 RepID=A0A0S1SIJ6_9BACT|nr:MAG: hypothetical protein PeribacterA2_1069 [Candidatus Peribacter riflensis]OGJ77957.1 MAG: hypothetical protein A2398_01545 [Candidatus Peribacteria bacterium RIFOXYB1_FULL_57_12]ALM11528.1 MAG: hypothetical protein PeribacterB2_1071 [Candidatus Peribacter riflensis]ALM12630.1 MAG: hypothetical protein PeribacterC2_1070 [Candidatus Peribacter riflensis]ALM13731.1 MAG: hypothetical protein PeribacterD1_1069 [Candidatus Peribacter riflensis]